MLIIQCKCYCHIANACNVAIVLRGYMFFFKFFFKNFHKTEIIINQQIIPLLSSLIVPLLQNPIFLEYI